MNRKQSTIRKKFFYLITFILFGVLTLIAGEILTRLLWKGKPDLVAGERNMNYTFDKELGWFPEKNMVKKFKGGRLIIVKNNGDGFRDRSHGIKEKKRIAFLGDSFVWGFDAEQEERFTEKLQSYMPGWEILNQGVCGYGTDQEFILIQKCFDHYRPDIVCLVFCKNDGVTNFVNSAYGHYKPYFELSGDSLIKRGVPVSKTISDYFIQYPGLFKSLLARLICSKYLNWKHPFHISIKDPTNKIIADMKAYVETKKAKFLIAFIDESDLTEKRFFCESNKIDYLSIFNNYRYESMGLHWTPRGHDFVCSKLYEFLMLHDSVNTTEPVHIKMR